jgi:HD domain-containing protein
MHWSRFIHRLFEAAKPYLAARGDMAHARVCYGYALLLMEKEGGDRRIVEPAVILHDVGWSALGPLEISAAFGVLARGEEAKRLNRIHEVEGALIARHILESMDYEHRFIESIEAIIGRHDSGAGSRSLEEELVRDADKLWRFSEIGFWKEVERQGLEPGHYHRFIGERIPGWFFSATARSLAESEHEIRNAEITAGGAKRDLQK